jgi:hypothetical protein
MFQKFTNYKNLLAIKMTCALSVGSFAAIFVAIAVSAVLSMDNNCPNHNDLKNGLSDTRNQSSYHFFFCKTAATIEPTPLNSKFNWHPFPHFELHRNCILFLKKSRGWGSLPSILIN